MPKEEMVNTTSEAKNIDVIRSIDPHLNGREGNAGRNPGKPGDFSGSTPGTKA